ncbi:MAG: hypothetical protein ACRCSN_04815 [Dermatophilaceae bacterium]
MATERESVVLSVQRKMKGVRSVQLVSTWKVGREADLRRVRDAVQRRALHSLRPDYCTRTGGSIHSCEWTRYGPGWLLVVTHERYVPASVDEQHEAKLARERGYRAADPERFRAKDRRFHARKAARLAAQRAGV